LNKTNQQYQSDWFSMSKREQLELDFIQIDRPIELLSIHDALDALAGSSRLGFDSQDGSFNCGQVV